MSEKFSSALPWVRYSVAPSVPRTFLRGKKDKRRTFSVPLGFAFRLSLILLELLLSYFRRKWEYFVLIHRTGLDLHVSEDGPRTFPRGKKKKGVDFHIFVYVSVDSHGTKTLPETTLTTPP